MAAEKKSKGERTREHILDTALGLFRKKGFQNTGMRDIAATAEMSPGAAYHYFPSKESLVLAYYAWTQDEHERRVTKALGDAGSIKEKLEILLLEKIKLLRRDRKLLAALFGSLGDPSHPLSLFGKETLEIRNRSIDQFREVFSDVSMSEEIRDLLGYSAWLAHLGVLLFFVHDSSRGQARTRKLAVAVCELIAVVMPFVETPFAKPLIQRVLGLAAELGLVAPPLDVDDGVGSGV